MDPGTRWQRCSLLALAGDEPLAGTAPVARRWVCVEQRGAWPSDLSTHPEPALAALATTPGWRLLLIRKPGRRGEVGAPLRVFLADTSPWASRVSTFTVDGPAPPILRADDRATEHVGDEQRVGVAQAGGGTHGQLGHLTGGRPRAAAPAAGRLDLARPGGLARRDRGRDVEPAVRVAGGEHERGGREPVAAEVAALPHVLLARVDRGEGERAPVHRAAAVAPAVGAHQQQRVAHRRAGERFVGPGQLETNELLGAVDGERGDAADSG